MLFFLWYTLPEFLSKQGVVAIQHHRLILPHCGPILLWARTVFPFIIITLAGFFFDFSLFSFVILISWLQTAHTIRQNQKILSLQKLATRFCQEREREATKQSRHLKTTVSLQSLGYYAASIFHNIAGPISTLNSLTFEIRPQLSNQQRKDMEACLRYICAVIHHAQRHIRHEVSPLTDIWLKETFEEIHDIVHSITIRQGITLNIDCPPSLQLNGDSILLRQMLLNLVQNSIEAMAETRIGTITLRARKQKQKILIQVLDTGKGMPKDQLHQIGTRFFTVKQNRTGLGTAFIKETMLHSFQGTCHYVSKIGKGTTATLSFPLTTLSAPVY